MCKFTVSVYMGAPSTRAGAGSRGRYGGQKEGAPLRYVLHFLPPKVNTHGIFKRANIIEAYNKACDLTHAETL